MKKDNQKTVVVVVDTRNPGAGCSDIVQAYLAEESEEKDRDGYTYPRTPEDIGPIFTGHGELGIYAHAFGDRPVGPSEVQYHAVHYVDAYKLDKMRKTLQRIEGKFAKYREARGYVQSLAECVLRFAEACGATQVVFSRKVLQRIDRVRGHEKDRPEAWRFIETGNARGMLDELANSYAPPAAAAAE